MFGGITATHHPAVYVVGTVVGILLAGITSAAVTFLVGERTLRPVFAHALAGEAPSGRGPAGILGTGPRLLVSWALGSGVALLAIALAFVGKGDARGGRVDRACPFPRARRPLRGRRSDGSGSPLDLGARGAVQAAEDEFHGELAIGVGLNSGAVVAGNVGGAGRLEFSVIGDAVNVAARVEEATRTTGDAILVSEHTRRLLSDPALASLEERPAIPLKGKTEAVALYAPATHESARDH